MRTLLTFRENTVELLRFSIDKVDLTEFPWVIDPKLREEGVNFTAGKEKVTFMGTTTVRDLFWPWVLAFKLSES